MSRRGAILQDYGGHIPAQDFTAQRDAASYYQRDKELAAQQQQQQQTAKQKEGKDATDYITGLKNDPTGINEVDTWDDTMLLREQNKMLEMQNQGKTLQDIKIYAMNVLPKLDKTSKLTKAYKDQIDKGLVDVEKTYGNGVDIAAYRNKAYKKLADDLFERDEKGAIVKDKDFEVIPKNKNYIAEIEDDEESLGTVFKLGGALADNIKKLPTPNISKSDDVRGKDGRLRYNGFTGQGSVFVEQDIDPETNVIKGLKYKSEKVPLGNNPDGTTNYAEVMPDDEFGILTQTPAAKKEFDIMFREHLRKGNIDPTKLDSRAKQTLKKAYALEWVKESNIDGSAFNPKMRDIQPLPPKNITNVRVNTGGAPVPVMDIVTPVRSYFENVGNQKEGLKGVAQLNMFNNEVTTPIMEEVKKRYPSVTADNIYYQKSGNDIWVMKAEETDESGKIKVNQQKDTPIFKLDDFSNVTGNKPQGVKSKNKALTTAQEGEANRSGKVSPKPKKDPLGLGF